MSLYCTIMIGLASRTVGISAQYYQTPDDLLFILTHTPTIPDFGQYEHDMRSFNQFVADNMTNKGIRTNEERFAIIARKH